MARLAETARRRRRAGVTTVLAAALAVATTCDASSPPADTAPPAAPVEVHARVEPASVPIGTRFRLIVEVTAAPGVEVMLTQPAERIGDFDIVDFGEAPAASRDGKTVVARWYELVGYAPGEHLVEAPPVRYRRPGEELAEAPKAETVISMPSVLAADATDIRDIKAPEEPPVDRRPYYVVAGGLAALLALGALLYRVLNRERRARPAPPPPPPHAIAVAELAALRRRLLVEQGAFKEYYSALSTIVRTYLERRFALRAPEMTTEEFLLSIARGGPLSPVHRGLLSEFLIESDLVKFARHLPAIADCERAYAAATRFVDETAPNGRDDAATIPAGARGCRGAGAATGRAAESGRSRAAG